MTRWRLTHLTQKKSAGIHLEQRLVFQIPESFWTFMEKVLSEWRWSLLSYVLLLFSWIPAFRQTLSPQVSPKGKIPKWGLAISCILVLLGKENIQEYPHHCTGLYTLDPEVFLVNFLRVRESEPLHDISSHFHCFTADSLWHRAKFKNNLCDQGTLASTTYPTVPQSGYGGVRCTTNADCRLADWLVNDENFNSFPIPKL